MVTASSDYTEVLKNRSASDEDKLVALKFVGHFVGDIHQPLHAGYKEDKGGNDLRVNFLGKKTNLHSVWDSGIIMRTGERWLDYAHALRKAVTAGERAEWPKLKRPEEWAAESHNAVRNVYAGVQTSGAIGEAYLQTQRPIVEEQLRKAGIRLGMLLNDALVPTPVGDVTGSATHPMLHAEAAAAPTLATTAAGKLEVHVIDRTGDAILIRCPDGQHRC